MTQIDFEGLHKKLGVVGWKQKKLHQGFCKYGKTVGREHNYVHSVKSTGGIMLECGIPFQHNHPAADMIVQCKNCFRQMGQDELRKAPGSRPRRLVRIK